MERAKHLRNAAIVLLIAAGLYWIPGGGHAERTFEGVVYLLFGVAIGFLGLRFYREYRVSLHSLGDRYRALLYGAIALAGIAVMGYKRLWQTSLGELIWFVLVGLAVYAVIVVWRYARSY